MTDKEYMALALAQAERAFKKNEIPIGAVVVDAMGTVLGAGYNITESKCSQSRHAEVIAIERAGKSLSDWRLSGCSIFVTIEPCLMCVGLIALSRIERIVYGAKSPLFGYHLDKECLPALYKKQIRGVSHGVLAQEAEALMKRFFKNQRMSRE